MKNITQMNSLLVKLGYTFVPAIAVAEYQKANGKLPSKGALNWFASIAPHLVLAYQIGTDGRSLEEYYPFLSPLTK